jgi:WD40 repeat protein
VTSVAWSPDGTRLASSSSTENRVDISDPSTGERILAIDMPKGITGNLMDMALHVQWVADGERLLTVNGDRYCLGSQDYDLLLWDASSGGLISSLEIANRAEPVSGDYNVCYVNYSTGAAAEIGPQGGRLVTLGGDNTAIVWDGAWQSPEVVLRGHTEGVNSVDWSPDEARVATSGLDGTARAWDGETGEELYRLEGHEGLVNVALWSPDGASLATAGQDGTVGLWNAANGDLLRRIETHGGEVYSLAWAPNSLRIVSGHWDGSLRIWEVGSGKLLETLRGHQGVVTDLKWSPVDDRLASADGSGNVRVWNGAPSTAYRLYPPQAAQGGDWSAGGADWSSDGRYLVLAGGDQFSATEPGFLSIWDVEANEVILEVTGDALPNTMGFVVAFSPDDQALLQVGYPPGWEDMSELYTAYGLDAATGEIIRTFTPGGDTYVRAVAWSPDGSRVATSTFYNEIIIWDWETGRRIARLAPEDDSLLQERRWINLNYVEWSPDGSKIAGASGDSTARVWDARTWELLYTVHHEPPAFVGTAAWSPDGTRLLTTAGNDQQGAKDNSARIWDGATGKELLVLRGHTKQVWPGSWSPDAGRIATASDDGTVRVWDSTTGAELLTLSVPVGYGLWSWWSPDGRHLAVVGSETTLSVWRVWQSTEELIEYAKECCVIREPTDGERAQFGLR